MASRHADRSSRYPDSRRDRDRGRDDRYGDDRSRRDRERERYPRDSYAPSRRSRSPHRRRERSRGYYDDRDRHRDRSRDRERDYRRRDDRRNSRERDRRHGSSSVTPAPEVKRSSDNKVDDRVSREEKHKRDQDKAQQDKEAELKKKHARLEEWKRKQLEKKGKLPVDTPGTGQSPAVTAPATPIATSTPPAREAIQEAAKPKTQLNETAERAKQKPKATFKLDESAKAKPLHGKVIAPSATSADNTKRAAVPQLKANGNISSFGLKVKPTEEVKAEKNALLDDEDNTSKRKLQALPDFIPEDGPSPPPDEDGAMSDIGSDDEETNAQHQAQLEKRRAEMAQEDTQMEDAPIVPEDDGDKMDVDNTAGAEEEDVDPLDAFMAGLGETPAASGAAPQGQALFGDDIEPLETAVEDEDLFALASSKKKKKEVPVIDHSKVSYPDFRKNFYTEPKEVSEMTPEEVADLRLELDGIKVKPENVPRPVTKWAQMGLLQQTMDVFQQVGYSKPTSIQSQAIPIAESGHDLIGVAKTGSGKTLAFGIPIIRHILDQPPLKSADGPIVLILAPTRELALQIVNELKPFLKASSLKIACAYGGAPISDQIATIKRGGIHVLCATPGRLIDLLQSNSGRVLSFRRITYVVLDEADRMFDMGFEPQVMKILANTRPDRQTILFSATFPKNMAALARKALKNPVELVIGGRSVVAPEITQIVTVVPPSAEKKMAQVLLQLGKLFNDDEDARALIFVERQETAEDLMSKIMKKGYPCNTIHGGKDQHDRTDAINDFKNGVLPLLIATSVAARGLDILQLKLVINYDCPTHLEDYVHRCGRTGRAGNTGTAVTLIENPGQERFAIHIAKALKQSGQKIPEDLQKMAAEFTTKVKQGTEKWYDPGFGGKGLDKLDAARALSKKREKRAAGGEFGDDSESEPETIMPTVVKNTAAVPAAETPAANNDADEPAYMKLLKSKIIVNKTERPSAESSKPMSAMERVKAAAMAVDGRLSKKGMIHHGQPIDNKGPDAGAYHSTIEINDFPQKARWAVTNRTNVAKILEQTGTSITTKGTYYAPGKEPQSEADLPKLYILVEGDNENVVTEAMMELTRLLKEGTMAADDSSGPRGPTGRYNVL